MPHLSSAFVVSVALVPLLATFSAMGLTPALIVLVLVMAAAARWRLSILTPDDRKLLIAVGAVLVWAFASAAWSITPLVSLTSALRLSALMATGFGGVLLARNAPAISRNGVLAFAAALAVCAVLLALEPALGLIQFVYDALNIDYARFINKNVNRGLCALVVLAWPMVSGLQRLGYARASYAVLAVLAVAVVGMDSLSATLALSLSTIVFALVQRYPAGAPQVLDPLIYIGFVTWPLVFFVLDPWLFSQASVYETLPGTAQHRVEIWRFVLGKVMQHPFIGWGLDTARAIPGGDVMYGNGRTYLPLHPHNSALQILLELGAVGFLMWSAVLALVLKCWRAVDPAHRASSGALLVAYLSIGFTAFGVWQYWWIATGFVAAMLWLSTARKT